MMETKYFVDAEGRYIGGFAGAEPPAGAIEVPAPPEDARQIWELPDGPWSPIPPQPYSVPATTLWLRMTDEEAETFDEAMNTANPIRLRRAFRAAQSMVSDGELFGFVKGVVTSAISAARADEIMAEPDFASRSSATLET